MNRSAVAPINPSPILALLEEQFSVAGLDALLDQGDGSIPWELWKKSLYGPLRDFLERPGKEFRAALVDAGYQLGGGHGVPPLELPLVVEMLHAGSLICDDIEDGSRYRRGKPALHSLYGVGPALNAGNWLYFWPQALVERMGLPPGVQLRLLRLITQAVLRCHHGQALDLSVHISDIPRAQIHDVVHESTRLKTGSLMELAIHMGALVAGASESRQRSLALVGRKVGIGLQMLDDAGGLLNEERLLKGHEDLVHDRPTWAWAWLSETLSDRSFERLRGLAHEVRSRQTHPEHVARIMRRVLRSRAPKQIHEHLGSSYRELRRTMGDHPALRAVADEIARLESSYV